MTVLTVLRKPRGVVYTGSAVHKKRRVPMLNPLKNETRKLVTATGRILLTLSLLFLASFPALAQPALDWEREGLTVDVDLSRRLSSLAPTKVIALADGSYRLYYRAGDGWTFADTRSATSADGVNWLEESGVRLRHGALGGVDNVDAIIHDVVSLPDGRLRAYYQGFDTTSSNNRNRIIGAASEDEGLSWVPEQVCVQPGGLDDGVWVMSPSVVELASGPYKYRMYYAGSTDRTVVKILSAVSEDGLSWTKEGVVLEPGGIYDTVSAADPQVLALPDGRYRMFYTGNDGSQRWILSATSSDGLVWTPDDGFRLAAAAAGSIEERIASPELFEFPDGWRMFYGGFEADPPGWGPTGVDRIFSAASIFFDSFDGSLSDNWKVPTAPGCTSPQNPQKNIFCSRLITPLPEIGIVQLEGSVEEGQRMGAELESKWAFPGRGTFAANVRFRGPTTGQFSHGSIKAFFTFNDSGSRRMEHDFEILTGKSLLYLFQGWLSPFHWSLAHHLSPFLTCVTHADHGVSQRRFRSPISLRRVQEEFLTLVVTVECRTNCLDPGAREYVAHYYAVVRDNIPIDIGSTLTVHDASSAELEILLNLWWLDPGPLAPLFPQNQESQFLDVDWVYWNRQVLDAVEVHRRGTQLDTNR